MTNSIQLVVYHDPHLPSTFHQDFLVILKHSLQNYEKILICFLCITYTCTVVISYIYLNNILVCSLVYILRADWFMHMNIIYICLFIILLGVFIALGIMTLYTSCKRLCTNWKDVWADAIVCELTLFRQVTHLNLLHSPICIRSTEDTLLLDYL